MKIETLAERLGDTARPSALLEKARRLGLRSPEDLERLAVRRGCLYYDIYSEGARLRDEPPPKPGRSAFSNTELAIALLSPAIEDSLHRKRLGAAMLSAPDVEPAALVALAKQEACEKIVKHIARCGKEVEPDNAFWTSILDSLADCDAPASEMPHPTRFFEMTGITRGKIGIQKRWIRPVAALALAP